MLEDLSIKIIQLPSDFQMDKKKTLMWNLKVTCKKTITIQNQTFFNHYKMINSKITNK